MSANSERRWCARISRSSPGRRCCTEALSDVSINPSPILLGKLLGITVNLCTYYNFSDLGICLAYMYCGRLELPVAIQRSPLFPSPQ
eukprot:COSAG05_NODE_117_length_17936_cov_137.220945_12_plen_87_part_00